MAQNYPERGYIPTISDTHKELYKLLQCIHHLEKTDQKELPKAFTKKQNELKRFLKPAQISDSFIQNYQTAVSKFIRESVSVLNSHYEARISETLGYLRSSRIPNNTLQIASRIALRWARRNFGRKLTQRTVNKFDLIVKSIAPTQQRNTPSPPAPEPSASNSPVAAAPHRTPPKPQNTPTTHKHTTTHSTTSTNPPHTPTSTNPNTPHTDLHSNPNTPRTSYSSVVRQGTSSKSPSTPHQQKTPTRPHQTESSHSAQSSPLSNASSSPSQTPNSQNTINVQGYNNPLSNFYPFAFQFNENLFISAEHAYQYKKAGFYEDYAAGERIKQTPTAAEARKIGKELDKKYHYHTKGDEWDIRKEYFMEDILFAKSEQCKQFREYLIETGDKKITHNIPDKFWGSTHNHNGTTMEGQNIFAKLLLKIRNKLVLAPRKTPQKPKQGLLPTPPRSNIPAPVPTSNRFSPFEEETADASDIPDAPDSPDTPDSPNATDSPVTQPTKRRRIGSPRTTIDRPEVVGPKIMVYRDRARWRLPSLKAEVVVIGDSNINRATNVESKVRSIEFHSFPGAKLIHFQNLLSPNLPKQNIPKAVILSIGMNNRTNRHPTFEPQLKSVIQNASKFFPNADIYVPLINIPPELPPHHQSNLDEFNRSFLTLAKQSQTFKTLPKELQTFKTLPKLPQKDFKIDPRDTAYKIHWSTETANAILSHWTSHLNC